MGKASAFPQKKAGKTSLVKGGDAKRRRDLTTVLIPPFLPPLQGGQKAAFTLAEVLITLGIIGVVAAMTLPTLVQKNQEREYVTKLKKFNTVMNQAFEMAKLEHGDIENWGLNVAGMNAEPTDEEKETGNNSVNRLFNIITPYLKTTSICKYGDSCETAKQYERYSLDGTQFSYLAPKIILSDGTTINGMTVSSPECKNHKGNTKSLQNTCGEIFVDLNGPKSPNATGKDVFLFYITKYGVVPMGTAEDTGFTFNNFCKISNPSNLNGYGCAAWIIYNGNMDYLHCNDLSWDGKTKCK